MSLRVLALLLSLPLSAPLLAADQPAEDGNVIWRDRKCAFFIVQSQWGFTLFEYLNGPWPEDNDLISGRLDGFGSRNVINKTADGQLTLVYSEISSTSKKWVGGKIPAFCRRKKDFLAQIEGDAARRAEPAAPASPAPPGQTSPPAQDAKP